MVQNIETSEDLISFNKKFGPNNINNCISNSLNDDLYNLQLKLNKEFKNINTKRFNPIFPLQNFKEKSERYFIEKNINNNFLQNPYTHREHVKINKEHFYVKDNLSAFVEYTLKHISPARKIKKEKK